MKLKHISGVILSFEKKKSSFQLDAMHFNALYVYIIS